MRKLWGRNNSINVQKVIWVLEELGLTYDRVDAGGTFGKLDTPEYKTLNPNGLIPTLQDGDLVVWESNTIIRYLANRYGQPPFAPALPAERSQVERWMDWELSTLNPHMRVLFLGIVRKLPEFNQPEALKKAEEAVRKVLTVLERTLANQSYVAGKDFTIGDIPLGIQVYRWMNLPIERDALPHIEAWYQRLQTRPVYRKHIMLPLT